MPNRLPPRLQEYNAIAEEVGHKYGVDPCYLLAILDRETAAGRTLKPPGPAGTGDWKPRHWSRYLEQFASTARYRHWKETREDEGTRLEVELCSPIDGLGWGRGLMQIDYGDEGNQDFLAENMADGTPAWQDGARNIDAAARMLAKLIRLFDGDEAFAASAYNAGPGRVSRALQTVTEPSTHAARVAAADKVTTGHNYGQDVLDRRNIFRRMLAMSQPQEP